MWDAFLKDKVDLHDSFFKVWDAFLKDKVDLHDNLCRNMLTLRVYINEYLYFMPDPR